METAPRPSAPTPEHRASQINNAWASQFRHDILATLRIRQYLRKLVEVFGNQNAIQRLAPSVCRSNLLENVAARLSFEDPYPASRGRLPVNQAFAVEPEVGSIRVDDMVPLTIRPRFIVRCHFKNLSPSSYADAPEAAPDRKSNIQGRVPVADRQSNTHAPAEIPRGA